MKTKLKQKQRQVILSVGSDKIAAIDEIRAQLQRGKLDMVKRTTVLEVALNRYLKEMGFTFEEQED